MSLCCCGLGCAGILACAQWGLKPCAFICANDSANWTLATPEEFEPIPRVSHLIHAVYELDLNHHWYVPRDGYHLNPNWVVKHVTYEQTQGHAPPYLIYTDHDHKEILLTIRGLSLYKESNYDMLLDNRSGVQMFDGGFVHHGLLKSAVWFWNEEGETLKSLWEENGKEYDIVFAGHSLGSGVAALLTILVVNRRDKFAGIPREKIRCYSLAPARCMSLNLAVRYADVIHSIILQDDFLPRTTTPLKSIFEAAFWLVLLYPCRNRSYLSLSFYHTNPHPHKLSGDTFIPGGRKLRDPRRLYAPGRMYHIVETRFCRCGMFPPEVRTAIPVDKRFDRVVLSCNAISDNGIIWIERESEKALQRMKNSETIMTPPEVQKLERLKTREQEHRDAQKREVSLNIPRAVTAGEAKPSIDNSTVPSEAKGEQNSKTNKSTVITLEARTSSENTTAPFEAEDEQASKTESAESNCSK